MRDFEIAQAYLAYWEQLADDAECARLRAWNEEHSPNPDGATPTKSLVPLFSPRQKVPTPDRPILASYGNLPYIPAMANTTNITARLEARLPVEVHALLKRAAEIEGRTLTDFVVAAASAAARKTIEEAEMIRLSVEDQQRFAEALIAPPPLKPAMKRAIARHRRLFAPTDDG